jgi:hypothetical protein
VNNYKEPNCLLKQGFGIPEHLVNAPIAANWAEENSRAKL